MIMQSEIIVQKPVLKKDGEVYTLSSMIKLGSEEHTFFYRVSGIVPEQNSNPFLAGVLLLAMKTNSRIKVEGKASRQLLKKIETIQDIFHCWYPDFSKIRIECEDYADVSPVRNGKAGCFFSGGVDSFYTLLKHRSEIASLIFVHGFDVSLEDAALRSKISSQLEKASEELGFPLVQVETNIRELMDRHLDWGKHSHGAAAASVALFLSSHFFRMYIGASDDYAFLIPWGSHPLLDPLWGTENLEIVHDGCEVNRVQKIESIVSNKVVQNHLRVCWENRDGSYNCGKCGKCLRVMANLRLFKALGKVRTFERPFELALLARAPIEILTMRYCAETTLKMAKRHGTDRPLIQALEDMLDEVYLKGLKGWPRRARGFLNRKILFREKSCEQVTA